MLLGAALAGVGALYFTLVALSDVPDLYRFRHLDAEVQRIVATCLAAMTGLVACISLAGYVTALARPRYLIFGRDWIDIPGYLGARRRRIPFADVTELVPGDILGQQHMKICTAGGQISFSKSLLPDAATFDRACTMLEAGVAAHGSPVKQGR